MAKNMNKNANSDNADVRNMGVIEYFQDGGGSTKPSQTDSTGWYKHVLDPAESARQKKLYSRNPKELGRIKSEEAAAKRFFERKTKKK